MPIQVFFLAVFIDAGKDLAIEEMVMFPAGILIEHYKSNRRSAIPSENLCCHFSRLQYSW